MKKTVIHFLAIFFAIVLLSTHAIANPGCKVILNNGDSLTGTLLNASFTIITSYGTFSLKTIDIKTIQFESSQAIINFSSEDRVTGKLQETDIKIKLALGSDISLQVSSIISITMISQDSSLMEIPEKEIPKMEITEEKVPDEKYVTNTIGMKFRLIPAGSFMMGSTQGEDDEKPVHKVTLTKPYYMGVYEVTLEQWLKVMTTLPRKDFDYLNHPAEGMTWEEIHEFLDKINSMGIGKYRLPTEAEWEYACRAGSKTRFYWGNDPDYKDINEYAWYTNNSGAKVHVVGQKKPNSWGLYDMSGNVAEWCQDWYGDYPNTEQTDPICQKSGWYPNRVARGGCYFKYAENCRSAIRFDQNPKGPGKISGFGFRLVISAD